ncbi:MAG: polysialyltransferase family glycosyltransferase [Planctomycetota bacterium]
MKRLSGPNLYFAYGPRHVFLATGHALASEGEHHLCIDDAAMDPGEPSLCPLLESWPQSPFASVRLLSEPDRSLAEPEDCARTRRHLQRQSSKRRRRRIKAATRELRASRVFVGTDAYRDFQYALSQAKACNPSVECVYLEDGTGAYAESFKTNVRPKRNPVRLLLKKLRNGWHWQEVRILGTSSWIDRAQLAFPELALQALACKQPEALAAEPYLGPPFTEFVSEAAEAFGADLEALESVTCVIILTKSTVASLIPGYADSIRDLCQGLSANGHRVLLKYHPREVDKDFLSMGEIGAPKEFPSGLPFEFLLPLIDYSRMILLGDVSSTLLASRWLCPHLDIRALRHTSREETASYLRNVHEMLRIPAYESVASLLADVQLTHAQDQA